MASHGSSEYRARVEQFAALSPQERQDLLMQVFARVRQLQQHPFRNRKEIDYAIGDLVRTVTGESSAYMNELTTICKGLYEHGRVKDPQTEKEMATFDDPREWFQGFGAVRALLGRFRGEEVDTAGDGFFATFDGPAGAVRCAQSISAREAYEESLAIGRELGYKRMIARSLTQLGETAMLEGKTDEAGALFEETLPIWQEIGHKSGLVDSLRGVGDVARLEHDHERAESSLTESLSVCREIGAREGEARALQSLAALDRVEGDSAEAAARYREAVTFWSEMEHVDGIATSLRGLGQVSVQRGAFERAARLFGAAEAMREQVGGVVPPCDREDLQRAIDTARAERGTELRSRTRRRARADAGRGRGARHGKRLI